jgi:hypothetical protein
VANVVVGTGASTVISWAVAPVELSFAARLGGQTGVDEGAVVVATVGGGAVGATVVGAGRAVAVGTFVLEAGAAAVVGLAVVELAVVVRRLLVPQAAMTRLQSRTPTSTARPDIALLSQQLIVVGCRRTLGPELCSPVWLPRLSGRAAPVLVARPSVCPRRRLHRFRRRPRSRRRRQRQQSQRQRRHRPSAPRPRPSSRPPRR